MKKFEKLHNTNIFSVNFSTRTFLMNSERVANLKKNVVKLFKELWKHWGIIFLVLFYFSIVLYCLKNIRSK